MPIEADSTFEWRYFRHSLTVESITREQLAAASFPHAVTQTEARETHISFVVLTGEYAYKVKKSVRLDFLDTRSLERRRDLCETELRLNRRYAPEIYLDVVPIARFGDRLHFDDKGEPIEYAVRMRQFDPRDELRSLLARDSIEAGEIAELAELLADFHREAPVLDATDHAGSHSFARKVTENIENVLQRAALVDRQSAAAVLQRWTLSELARQRDNLHERERNGRIRECHGDLHTGNVVRWQGRLVPFDCIEFDAELRYIDVLSDIAFLTMDLVSRNRADLAFTLLNRYLERSGDYLGAGLLPCYLVYRAAVRAKVALISLEQHPDSSDARNLAISMLDTAQRFTQKKKPALIIMHGASGSGKSWLSERLVSALPAVRIRSDLERKRLAGLDPFSQDDAGNSDYIYSLEFNERTYAHLFDCARAGLRGRLITIVDAAFLKVEERRMFAQLAADEDAEFLILACHADEATLGERIERRRAAGTDPSDATVDVLRKQLRAMQPLQESEIRTTLRVDTRAPSALQSIREWLDLRDFPDHGM